MRATSPGVARPGAVDEPRPPGLPTRDDHRQPDERRLAVHRRRDRHGHAALRPTNELHRHRRVGLDPQSDPNGQYSVSASTTSGLVASTISQMVPNAIPIHLTSTFNLALAQATGTLSISAMNGVTPIADANITVTGGPNGVDLTGNDRRKRRPQLPEHSGRLRPLHSLRHLRRGQLLPVRGHRSRQRDAERHPRCAEQGRSP